MKSLPRWLWAIVALVVLAAIGYGWLKLVHDPQVRRVAQLEDQRDSLDRAIGQLRWDSANHAAEDSVREASIAVILRRARATPSHPPTESAARHADSLARAAGEAVQDSAVRVTVETAFAAKDSVIAQMWTDHLSDVARLQGDILEVDSLRRAQLATRDADLANLRAALEEMTKQRDRWAKEAKPNFVISILRNLPLVAASVGVGVIIGAAVF